MDAQTLAETIKRSTKRGEWWIWAELGKPKQHGDVLGTLLSWRWLARRALQPSDPLRAGNNAQFAYRWTDAKVPEFHV